MPIFALFVGAAVVGAIALAGKHPSAKPPGAVTNPTTNANTPAGGGVATPDDPAVQMDDAGTGNQQTVAVNDAGAQAVVQNTVEGAVTDVTTQTSAAGDQAVSATPPAPQPPGPSGAAGPAGAMGSTGASTPQIQVVSLDQLVQAQVGSSSTTQQQSAYFTSMMNVTGTVI